MSTAQIRDGVTAVLQGNILKRPLLELLWSEEQQLLQSCPAILISVQKPGDTTQIDTSHQAVAYLHGMYLLRQQEHLTHG